MLKRFSILTVITLIIGIAALQSVAESISGTVVDNTGEDLVQNGWVQIRARNEDNGDWHDDWAGSDGSYQFGLYPGVWHVWVRVHERSGYWGSTTKSGEEGQPKYVVTVNQGDALVGYDFEILADSTPPVIDDVQVEGTPKAGEDIAISAQITDAGSSTLNPYRIYIRARKAGDPDEYFHHNSMKLDSDGRWRGYIRSWRVTTAGVEYFIEAVDYADNLVRNPSDGKENPLLIETINPSDATISGTVTDDGGAPLEGARVEAGRHEGGGAYAYTDASGNYSLEVAAGTWNIHTVELENYYPVNPPRRPDPINEPFKFVDLYENIDVTSDTTTVDYPGYVVAMAEDPTPPNINFNITVLPSNGITISVHVDDPESGVYGGSPRFYWRFIDRDWGWNDIELRDWKYDPIKDEEVRDRIFEGDIRFDETGIIEYFFEAQNAAHVESTNPSPRPNDDPNQEPHGNYAVVIAAFTTDIANYRDEAGNTKFNDQLIGPGTIISAADPDGVLCGGFIADVTTPQTNPGEYGYMPVHSDDPDTIEDEGMLSGEMPTFYIFDEPNRRNTRVKIVSGDATWEKDANLNVDLEGFSVVRRIIELEQNWNLIGIAGEPYGGDTSVQSVLHSIEGQYELVIGYDPTGAIIFDPDPPEGVVNTMTNISNLYGFYIHMYEPSPLDVEIYSTSPTTPISMITGWNLPNYLPEDSRDVATALDSISAKYDWVKALYPRRGGFRVYNPGDLTHSTLQEMSPPFAYFILMNQDASLTYDVPPAPTSPPAHIQPMPVVQRGLIPTTSMMFFYGNITVHGQPAPKGTVVEAFDPDGVKIGKFVVREAGKFGYMPAYQDENVTSLDEGANPGDVIAFSINGQPAITDKTTTWTKFGDRVKLTLRLDKSSEKVIPEKFTLEQNYPNPLNPETWIPYQLPQDATVVIQIYSATGELVRTLDLGRKSAGFYFSKQRAAYWDGRNSLGEQVASGVYFYTIKTGKFTATKRMIVVR